MVCVPACWVLVPRCRWEKVGVDNETHFYVVIYIVRLQRSSSVIIELPSFSLLLLRDNILPIWTKFELNLELLSVASCGFFLLPDTTPHIVTDLHRQIRGRFWLYEIECKRKLLKKVICSRRLYFSVAHASHSTFIDHDPDLKLIDFFTRTGKMKRRETSNRWFRKPR